MFEHQPNNPDTPTDGEISRQRFLMHAAVVAAAGGAAFVAPEILTMKPAGAETLTSPPPQPYQPPETTPPAAEVPQTPVDQEELPYTGFDAEKWSVIGAGAVVTGAVMARVARNSRVTEQPADIPSE